MMSQKIIIIILIFAICSTFEAAIVHRSDELTSFIRRRKTSSVRSRKQTSFIGKLRPGDAGVTFDTSMIDANKNNFPEMERWSKAGVTTGIPLLEKLTVDDELSGGDSESINKKIGELSKAGEVRVLLLKNGEYKIDREVTMRSNVYLIGESRAGVRCRINMEKGNAFYFGNGVENSGIYRLTIEGTWGKPKYDWNIGTEANNELPGNENVSVMFRDSTNCWIDGVNIYNSGDFPVRCNAKHITMRDLDVDGVFNKQGGAHGYFFILEGDNLITQCKITHLRHISLQGDGVEYNVVYDNDFQQEISFHSDDDGKNLIENNRITIPKDMPNGSNGPDYRAIMGPWSSIHSKSKKDNFLHNNELLELNHDGVRRMSDDTVYAGPIFDNSKGEQQTKNFPPFPRKPIGGKLYPIILS